MAVRSDDTTRSAALADIEAAIDDGDDELDLAALALGRATAQELRLLSDGGDPVREK